MWMIKKTKQKMEEIQDRDSQDFCISHCKIIFWYQVDIMYNICSSWACDVLSFVSWWDGNKI